MVAVPASETVRSRARSAVVLVGLIVTISTLVGAAFTVLVIGTLARLGA